MNKKEHQESNTRLPGTSHAWTKKCSYNYTIWPLEIHTLTSPNLILAWSHPIQTLLVNLDLINNLPLSSSTIIIHEANATTPKPCCLMVTTHDVVAVHIRWFNTSLSPVPSWPGIQVPHHQQQCGNQTMEVFTLPLYCLFTSVATVLGLTMVKPHTSSLKTVTLNGWCMIAPWSFHDIQHPCQVEVEK